MTETLKDLFFPPKVSLGDVTQTPLGYQVGYFNKVVNTVVFFQSCPVLEESGVRTIVL